MQRQTADKIAKVADTARNFGGAIHSMLRLPPAETFRNDCASFLVVTKVNRFGISS